MEEEAGESTEGNPCQVSWECLGDWDHREGQGQECGWPGSQGQELEGGNVKVMEQACLGSVSKRASQ
jgi:hypothetical protein